MIRAEGRNLGRAAAALVLASASMLVLSAEVASAAKRGLDIGFGEGQYQSTDAASRAAALNETMAVNAGTARLVVRWREIAPTSRGPGFDPTNPADPRYDWSRLDAAVSDASARGLRVLLLVTHAPDWAEGKNRPPPPCPGGQPCDNNPYICPVSGPPCAAPGTWKPKPGELAAFGTALARRYSGSFGSLPWVRDYLVWAEPNLEMYLTPQWKGKRPAAPGHYARMLNAFYRSVHQVNGANRVVGGGTAPYGADRGVFNMRPLLWWRELMCLKGRKRLRTTRCKTKPKFDVAAHHPINTSGGPGRSAIHPDDVSTPDLHNLRKALRFAERKRTVDPGGPHPIWVTELWWETNPPDPLRGHPSPRKQARWYAEAFYRLWRQGASMILLLQVRDDPYDGDPGRVGGNYQSGIYFASGRPKPAVRFVRFPFVADRRRGKRVVLWGKAPEGGKLVVQRKRRRGGFRGVTSLTVKGGAIFNKTIKLRGQATLRAKVGGQASPQWRVR